MNVFDLAAVLRLDKSKFVKGLDDAEGEAQGKGAKIGSALGAVGKAAAVGIGAAAGALGGLTKKSIEAYADYEQLTGGVETLFKESGDIVMGYAENAYKAAGLSANNYMETVTGFSASLIAGLGGDTEKAAKLADVAIVDMSDNANKMGTSMESIQNAYQGFAKQNYTMLDNLKLGYGGTKEEMQRLLSDAEKLTGKKFDVSNFGDIVQAIHAVQENLDIAGTTSKEATETISGSIGMTKSAWENLVTGITNPDADISKLIGDLIESAGAAIGNLLPAIEQALSGIGQTVSGLAPQLSEIIVKLVTDVAPDLIKAGGEMILTLATALVDNLPEIIKTGTEVLLSLAQGIAENLPTLIPAIIDAIMTIAETLTEPDNLLNIINAGIDIIAALVVGILKALPRLILGILTVFKNIRTTLGEKLGEVYLQWEEWRDKLHEKIVNALKNVLNKLKEWFTDVKSKVKSFFSQVKDNIVEWAKERVENVAKFFTNIVEKLKGWVESVYSNVTEFFINIKIKLREKAEQIKEKVKTFFEEQKDKFKSWGKDLIDNFVGGLKEKIDNVVGFFKNMAEKIKDLIGFSEPKEGPLSNFHTFAPDMMKLFAQGIKDNEDMLKQQVAESFDFSDMATSPDLSMTSTAGFGAPDYTKEDMAADIRELLMLFKTGRAMTAATIENTRELGRAINA